MANRTLKKPWLKKHIADPYVQLAQHQGFRSRAAYKLLAIHEKDHLFKKGQIILDLGAAPGAWSQLARQKADASTKIIAIDRLPMQEIEGVTFIQGDVEEDQTLQRLHQSLEAKKVDLVLSDIAPNLSGIASIDQPRSYVLAQLVLDLSKTVLKKEGNLLIKCFQGKGFQEYYKQLQHCFSKVVTRKPKASRARSSEVYLLAKSYQNPL